MKCKWNHNTILNAYWSLRAEWRLLLRKLKKGLIIVELKGRIYIISECTHLPVRWLCNESSDHAADTTDSSVDVVAVDDPEKVKDFSVEPTDIRISGSNNARRRRSVQKTTCIRYFICVLLAVVNALTILYANGLNNQNQKISTYVNINR